ncbi:MAG: phosphatase PAP2 family protein [Spirochaetaceae bacterium]|jgi:membrane-associated phospholipid phosphatase|nr:phosphatase PAP2 family protein [Spirochaetaceae bacterium]
MRDSSDYPVLKGSRTQVCTVFFLLIFFISFQPVLKGQSYRDSIVPVLTVFHNIGGNALDSLKYNYGMNFIGAITGTYLSIETKLDWGWRNIAYNNPWLSDMGLPGLYIGYSVPALAPIVTYVTGRFIKDERLQMTGLALAQALLLTLMIQSPLKMITGRAPPHLVSALDHRRMVQESDLSRTFNWFNFNFIAGWPSGHTATAFSAAATLAQLYHDKPLLKAIGFIYATFIGLGVTVDVHWFSEALAGALIGYAIGTTVGRDFNQLLHKTRQPDTIAFYCTLNSIGIRIQF